MAQNYQSQRHGDINRILTGVDLCTLDQDDLTCSICKETMEHNPQKQLAAPNMAVEDLAVRLNECGHIYCRDCITDWLTEKSTCPMCRRVVLPLPRATASLSFWRMVRSDCIHLLHVYLENPTQLDDESDVRNFLAFIEEMTSENVLYNDLVVAVCLRITSRPSLFARENLIPWLATLHSGLDQQNHEQDIHDLAEFTEMVLSFQQRRATAMNGGAQIE